MPATRRTKNNKKVEDTVPADESFGLSQRSMSSDDGMMKAVAKQMQSTWEKKKKEKQARFLQAAKKELDSVMNAHKTEVAEGMDEINTIFEKFAMDYALLQDEIRKIWVQIIAEQEDFKALTEKKSKAAREGDKERETKHIQALVRVKRACEDQERLIQGLVTPSTD